MENLLRHESSPYLLQHAQNPVHWQAWNAKALQQAKCDNKLIIVSIGYATCHWCHVMEHESFENAQVAALMNESFVCIKVDREERPDIDQLYMDALHTMNGQGGWPLNMICLPDTTPVYGGTYFRKEQWMQVLRYFGVMHKESPEKLADAGNQMREILSQQVFFPTENSLPDREDIAKLIEKIISATDSEKGGKRGAPKFPMPVAFEVLLENYHYTQKPELLTIINTTLTNMGKGGLYDLLRGGFARYSVDEDWLVPHFEKMLYDNAQLLSLYSHAFQLNPNPNYAAIITETVHFFESEMLDKNGGFYSAIDADSEGEEGKFYVWSYDELAAIAGEDFESVKNYFEISKYGNFEGKIILTAPDTPQRDEKYAAIKKQLIAVQNNRIRPITDDKQLTAWNALAIIGLTDAAMALQNQHYLTLAKNTADFIHTHLIGSDGILYRNYKKGKTTIYGFLDDYAFTARAFLKLFYATSDSRYFHQAKALVQNCITHFYDQHSKLFFYTADFAEKLMLRKIEYQDNVIPSSNAMMAEVLLDLYYIEKDEKYKTIVRQQLEKMTEWLFANPFFFSKWLSVLQRYERGVTEIVLSGENAQQTQQLLLQKYRPDSIILVAEATSELAILQGKYSTDNLKIWVCKDQSCLPAYDSFTQFLKENGYE